MNTGNWSGHTGPNRTLSRRVQERAASEPACVCKVKRTVSVSVETHVGGTEVFRDAHCPSVLVHTGPRPLTRYQELQCKYAWWITNIFVNFI